MAKARRDKRASIRSMTPDAALLDPRVWEQQPPPAPPAEPADEAPPDPPAEK
jgi:hypothetical protein